MKKFAKSMLGVTLLEIMLVLAIAAMIIVMSVRYYQSATANQQSNAVLQMVQGVTAAADSLSQATGSYATITDAQIQSLMPNRLMTTPWGSTIAISNPTANTYTVTIPSTPAAVCVNLVSRLAANTKYTTLSPATPAACPTTGTGSVSYVYNSQS